MKTRWKQWVGFTLAVALVGSGLALAQKGGGPPAKGQQKPPAGKQEQPQKPAEKSYWDKFKGVFVDWDDNAKPGQAKTQVSGTRGVNVEKSLGNKGYDWAAVAYMEDYQVSMEEAKQFLEEGQLGPYQPE